MDGQMLIADFLMNPCDCGSSDIEIKKVGQGMAMCYSPLTFEHWLYWCKCKNCGRYGTDDSLLHWRSLAKTRQQAIAEWNRNPRKIVTK